MADKKDTVSGAEEQQVASPVEAIITFVLVETPGTHLRVSARKKEAATAFIQDESFAREPLIGLIGNRKDGLPGLSKARSEPVER